MCYEPIQRIIMNSPIISKHLTFKTFDKNLAWESHALVISQGFYFTQPVCLQAHTAMPQPCLHCSFFVEICSFTLMTVPPFVLSGLSLPPSCWEHTALSLKRVYILSMLQIIC